METPLLSLPAFLAALAAAPPAPPPVDADGIVVTRSRSAQGAPQRPDAVEVLRNLCFEPARLTGRFQRPAEGPPWDELGEQARRQFDAEDPTVPAFVMDDPVRDQQVWLKLEVLRAAGGLREQRCTLLVVGGRDHKRFVQAMSQLLRGPPTQRHVGEQDGSPAIPGWEQWLWTGMPARGSRSWHAIESPRGGPPTWLVVANARGFYEEYDYLMGDMKSRTGAAVPVTMLTFSVTTKDGAAGPPPGRRR